MTTTRTCAIAAGTAAALLVGALTGCSRTVQGGAAPSNTVTLSDGVPVRVQNNSRAAMKILVVDGGSWRFVGLVDAGSTASFDVSGLDRSGAPLRLLATPVGGQGAARAGPLTVLPSQTVTFTIETDLARSFAVVR